MNKYLKEIKNNTVKHLEKQEQHKQKLSELKTKRANGTLEEPSYQHYVLELNKQREQETKAFQEKMIELKNKYHLDIESWAKLDGSKVNAEDTALLNSGIQLQAKDYEELEQKHAGNYTMLRAVSDSAKKNNINYSQSYVVDPSVKTKEMNGIIDQALDIAKREYKNEFNMVGGLWQQEGKFEEMYAQSDKATSLDLK
ncbi:MAG: hypothetical protein L0J35_00185 [Tetragenococcus halophilus]|nr:hypothetical protein [Tetragenococcus halophilus]